ncbi:hypothetical protein [Algoriphagus terrigena]|nr:hypothetical protein [Algoriphagus terrigena]
MFKRLESHQRTREAPEVREETDIEEIARADSTLILEKKEITSRA